MRRFIKIIKLSCSIRWPKPKCIHMQASTPLVQKDQQFNLVEKYSSYELEVLAIVNVMKKWRVYLLGEQFSVVTDCIAFLRAARSVIALQQFKFRVDALSRLSCFWIIDYTRSRLVEPRDNFKWIKAIKTVLTSHDAYEDYFESRTNSGELNPFHANGY